MGIISINTTTQILATTTNALMTIGEYVVVEMGIEWGGQRGNQQSKQRKFLFKIKNERGRKDGGMTTKYHTV